MAAHEAASHRLGGRLRPYRLLTPTVGRVERVRLFGGIPEPLVQWRWWARLPLVKRLSRVRAYEAALSILTHEFEGATDRPQTPDDAQWMTSLDDGKEDDPQAFAVQLAAATGYGTPDDWREVRIRDAMYLLNLIVWRNLDPKKREGHSPPRWSAPAWSAPAC